MTKRRVISTGKSARKRAGRAWLAVAFGPLVAALALPGCGRSGAETPRPTETAQAEPSADRDKPAGSAPLVTRGQGGERPSLPPAGKRPALPAQAGARSAQAKEKEPAATKTAHSDYAEKEEPVDPVKANGPIFEGWEEPDLAIVFSGLLEGYMEPCGCAGLTNQKGGFAHRHTFLKQLSDDGWPVAAFELGGLVKRFGRQQEIKYHALVDGLKTMGYSGIALGPQDLRLPGEVLFAAIAPVGDEETPFIAANVTIFDESALPKYKIVEAGGKKLGVTSVIGLKYQQGVSTDGVQFADPVASLEPVMRKLQAAKCDHLILLSHATLAESTQFAKRFPQFDIVVTAGGADEPPAQPLTIGKTQLVEVGHKGMYVCVVGVYDGKPLKYQRVPLDHRFKDSDDMQQLMLSYQQQLEELGLEGLGLRPQPHPSGLTFTGSQACAECHTTAHEIWQDTPHSHATETLVKLDIPRQFDPECLSCHATGWEPQQYYPYQSGYLGLKETPLMTENGCENCHGPGSAHVAAEKKKATPKTELVKLRKELRVAKTAANCLKCHDPDNSPDFVKEDGFETYWPQVEHYGRE